MSFCPVCKSAGKSKEEYTSHFVKDRPGGVVVCPTLLNQECNYCHDKGHTIKYCPKLKEKNERHQYGGWQHAHKPIDYNWQSIIDYNCQNTSGSHICPPPPPQLRHYNSFNQKKRLERYCADGFVCDGACSEDAPSPPSHVYEEYPPLSVLNKKMTTTPKRVGVKIPSCRLTDIIEQEKIEEDVSLWAGRSTAYTLEEDSIANTEMEQEAEYQADLEAFDLYCEEKEYSRFERPMPTLEDCTWG